MDLQSSNSQTETETDNSIPKIIFLFLIQAFFSFLFSLLLNWFFDKQDWQILILSFSCLVVFLIFYLLNVYFIKHQFIAEAANLASALAMVAGFYNKISAFAVIGALAASVFLVWGNFAGKNEIKNLIKIKFGQTSRRILPKAIIGVSLFVSLVFYGSIKTAPIKENEIPLVSQSVFEQMLKPVSPLFKKLLPEFDLSISIGEFIDRTAKKQIEDSSLLGQLPQQLKAPMISQAAKNLESQLSGLVGAPIKPGAKVSDFFYNYVAKMISSFSGAAQQAIPLIAATILFLTFWSFSWIVRWIVFGLAYFLYEIFIALGFARVIYENSSREVVVL